LIPAIARKGWTEWMSFQSLTVPHAVSRAEVSFSISPVCLEDSSLPKDRKTTARGCLLAQNYSKPSKSHFKHSHEKGVNSSLLKFKCFVEPPGVFKPVPNSPPWEVNTERSY
jgi:hypothetical protein